MKLKAVLINCSLKKESSDSSTNILISQIQHSLSSHGVESESVYSRNYNILPGVNHDEGENDEWSNIKEKIDDCDLLVIGTPIWLGQPSSIAKRVLERMNAYIDDTDEHGRMKTYGKVACVCVVGNEDGAHHVSAELYQALNDVGFTLPANAISYWVGEAMQGKDYKDHRNGYPEKTTNATSLMVRNAVHLAKLLREKNYQGEKG
ncbi:MAG: NADPH-dependent oxidoreductase [Halobacteriovoraceae bacterium]|nr:NADPH-dependent oxidoreductase [Halobacteriovoraceae bacterium]|tara:strand:+ start:17025 stop:17639 length:615 start_codon:yes stop_codon:yes gene_type:complete